MSGKDMTLFRNPLKMINKVSNKSVFNSLLNGHLQNCVAFDFLNMRIDFYEIISIFAALIQKDGGIRPCDVLASCKSNSANTYPTIRS
jgi:hypothetical protein